MFTEFLHPELVLFGNFMDVGRGCPHHVEVKDGEIVVHQEIKRAWNASGMFRSNEMKKEKLDYSPGQLNEDQMEYLKRQEEYEKEQEEEDEYQEYDQDEDQENPYDDEYYGYDIARQYKPQELIALLNSHKNLTSPEKIQQIPYTKISPKKESQSQAQAQAQNQDEDWQTQEQQQDFVTNQLLEQAGGNFAVDA